MAYTKVIQSGSLVEQWVYAREPSPRRLEKKPRRVRRVFLQERRADNIIKCRNAFRRLVRANLDLNDPPLLVTLTMREIVSVDEAYKCFTAYALSMRKKHPGIKYISVPEFQKRGAVHFHILMFGLKNEIAKNERRTRYLASFWKYGFLDVKVTDGGPRLSSYLAKYMSKAMHDKRLIGKRAYSASRNVSRPSSLNSPFQIETSFKTWGLTGDNQFDTVRDYDTLFLGKCVYKTFLIPDYGCRKSTVDHSESGK